MITILIYIIALILNILIFTIIGASISTLPVSVFVISIYLLPIIINFSLILINKYKNLKVKHLIYILPAISSISYIVFGNVMMNSESWNKFVSSNNYVTNNLFVNVTNNLVSSSQIIFVIILNFAILYLLNMLLDQKKGDR